MRFPGVQRRLQKAQDEMKVSLNEKFKTSKFKKKLEFRPNGQDYKAILAKLES